MHQVERTAVVYLLVDGLFKGCRPMVMARSMSYLTSCGNGLSMVIYNPTVSMSMVYHFDVFMVGSMIPLVMPSMLSTWFDV